MADNFMYFATANDVGTSSPGGATKGTPARLESVTVGTAAASAVLTIYHGIDTNGPVVATIDCSAINNFQFGVDDGIWFPAGLYAKLTVGNAKVTLSYDGD